MTYYKIHLTGGAGVGKKFRINAMPQYVKGNIKYHSQKSEQTPIVVTVCIGKAGSYIIILISLFIVGKIIKY